MYSKLILKSNYRLGKRCTTEVINVIKPILCGLLISVLSICIQFQRNIRFNLWSNLGLAVHGFVIYIDFFVEYNPHE